MRVFNQRRILATILAVAALGLALHPAATHKDAAMGRSPDLTAQYNDFNFRYFGGDLPPVTVEVTERQPYWIAETIPCGPRCFRIIISDPWTPASVEKTEALMHEMCHSQVELDGHQTLDPHGVYWQDCMMRLASEGAFTPMNANGVFTPIW